MSVTRGSCWIGASAFSSSVWKTGSVASRSGLLKISRKLDSTRFARAQLIVDQPGGTGRLERLLVELPVPSEQYAEPVR